MSKIHFLTSLAAILLAGLAALQANAVQDDKSLQGTWTLVSGESNGKALSADEIKGSKLTIKGNDYEVVLPGRTVTGTEKLDTTKKPMTIDITDATGANKGKTCLGIIEIKADEFRVVLAPPGKDRPTTFKTAPDSGQWMHVWKRAKN